MRQDAPTGIADLAHALATDEQVRSEFRASPPLVLESFGVASHDLRALSAMLDRERAGSSPVDRRVVMALVFLALAQEVDDQADADGERAVATPNE